MPAATKEITDYLVLEGYSTGDLSSRVTAALSQGWKLRGSPYFMCQSYFQAGADGVPRKSGENLIHCQCMIKESVTQ